jgi:hypothetical protein
MSLESSSGDESPRMERWLLVMLSSFVPLLAALFLPREIRIPLLIGGAVLAAVGFLLLLLRKPAA